MELLFFFSFISATDYVETSLSYPRQRGDLSILESRYIVGAVNCLSFKYNMSGERIGRLNVYIVGQDEEVISLPWRLADNQSNEWEIAYVPIDAAQGFKVSNSNNTSENFSWSISNPRQFCETAVC